MNTDKLSIKKLFVQLYIRFVDDDISALSAQLSFYLLMSGFPFLLFMLNVLSYTPVSVADFVENITKFMPKDVALIVSGAIYEMVAAKSLTLLSLSALVTLISASRGISAISKGLNKAYNKEESRHFLKVKGISVIFTIGIALIILAVLLFLIFGNVIGGFLFRHFPDKASFAELWSSLRYAVPVGMMALVFTLLFVCVPNCRVRFKEALPGSLFCTAGWIAVSAAFSVYVNNFGGYTSIYGSIGGIIILLIWLYLSSMIILLGGEINAALSYFRSGKKTDKYENPSVKIPFIKKKV